MPDNSGLTRRQFVGRSLLPMAAANTLAAGAVRAADADARRATAAASSLFAFDDVSIPFRHNLRLQMHQPRKHPANPVLPRGKESEPDTYRAQFYAE